MNERSDPDAGLLDGPAGVPEVPELPDVADGFVEVRPGAWVRATCVVAISQGYRVDSRDPTRTHVYTVDTGGPATGAAAYRSPFSAAQLLCALRQAEHVEDVRRLELLARLLTAYAARTR